GLLRKGLLGPGLAGRRLLPGRRWIARFAAGCLGRILRPALRLLLAPRRVLSHAMSFPQPPLPRRRVASSQARTPSDAAARLATSIRPAPRCRAAGRIGVLRRAADIHGEATKGDRADRGDLRSEEHTSELQSREKLVCRLL